MPQNTPNNEFDFDAPSTVIEPPESNGEGFNFDAPSTILKKNKTSTSSSNGSNVSTPPSKQVTSVSATPTNPVEEPLEVNLEDYFSQNRDVKVPKESPLSPAQLQIQQNQTPNLKVADRKLSAQKELETKGITSEQRNGYSPASKVLYNKITPDMYGSEDGEGVKDVLLAKGKQLLSMSPREKIDPYSEDAWAMYLGLPQENKTFRVSPYQPTKAKTEQLYYALPVDFEKDLFDAVLKFEDTGKDEEIASLKEKKYGTLEKSITDEERKKAEGEIEAVKSSSYRSVPDSVDAKDIGIKFRDWDYSKNIDYINRSFVLGNFTVDKGEDEKGKYISYYDKIDYSPSNIDASKVVGKPFEVYGRIYYDKTENGDVLRANQAPQNNNGGEEIIPLGLNTGSSEGLGEKILAGTAFEPQPQNVRDDSNLTPSQLQVRGEQDEMFKVLGDAITKKKEEPKFTSDELRVADKNIQWQTLKMQGFEPQVPPEQLQDEWQVDEAVQKIAQENFPNSTHKDDISKYLYLIKQDNPKAFQTIESKASQGLLSEKDKFTIEQKVLAEDLNTLAGDAKILKERGDEEALQQKSEQYFKIFDEYKNTASKYPDVLAQQLRQKRYEPSFRPPGMYSAYGKISDQFIDGLNRLRNIPVSMTEGVLRMSKNLGESAAQLAGADINEYGVVDRIYDKAAEGFDFLTVPTKQDPLFNDDGSLNPEMIAPTVIEQAGVMAALMLGGKAVSADLGRLGLSQSAAQVAGLTVSGYMLSAEGYYQKAKELGLSDDEAKNFSHNSAMLQGALESVNPNLKFLFGAKPLLEGVEQMVKAGIKPTTKELAKTYFTNIGKENAQETMQLLGDKANEFAANQALDENYFNPEVTKNEIVETVFITSLVTGLMGGGELKLQGKNADAARYSLAEMYKLNPEKVDNAIEVQKQAGNITDEQATNLTDEIKKRAKALEKIPQDIPEETKVEIAPLIEQKQDSETQIQNIEAEKEKLDPIFHPAKDEEIKIEEEKIEASDTEIKKIIAEPEKEVGVEDIEKRRQEELNQEGYRIPVSKESRTWTDEDGTKFQTTITTFKDGSKQTVNKNLETNVSTPTSKYDKDLSNEKIYEVESPNAIERGEVKQLQLSENKVTALINAKYDAELKTLKPEAPKSELVEQTPKNVEEVPGSNVEGGKKEVVGEQVDVKGSTPVYHGTFADFGEFDPRHLGKNTGSASAKEGYFFAANPKVAESYATDNIAKGKGLEKYANAAKKELKKLTGDDEFQAAYKSTQREYHPTGDSFVREDGKKIKLYDSETQKKVDKLLGKIDAYDDFINTMDNEYFAPEGKLARSGKLKSVYLDMKNPFIKDYKGDSFRDEKYVDVIKKAKANGHDGVIFKNTYDGNDQTIGAELTDIHVVFDKSQIKTKPTAEVKQQNPIVQGSEVVQTKEAPKTKFQLATDARRAAKAKLDSLKPPEGSLGIAVDPKERAQALFDYHKTLVIEAKEAIKDKVKTIEEWLERTGDTIDDAFQRAWDEATKKIRKQKIEDFEPEIIQSKVWKEELTEGEKEAADRLTDNPIQENEPPPPIETTEVPKSESNQVKIRKVFDAFMNRSEINDGAKKLLKENPNSTYVVFNALAKKDVIELSKEIVDRVGHEQALIEATNMENGLLPRERMLLLGGIVNDLNARVTKARGEKQFELSNQEIDTYNKLINQATDFAATYATDMGQAIEAIKDIYKMSAISVMRKLKKTLDTANEMNAPNAQRTVDAVMKELQDENKYLKTAAEEMSNLDASQKATIAQLQKELRDAIKNAKSKESRLGSKENPVKVIKEVSRDDFEAAMKRLGGKLRTGLNKEDLVDLDTIATFAIQKGIGKFSEFYDTLRRSLPNKYHEAIEDAYKNARDKSIEAGESRETFDTNDVIADIVDTKAKETDANVIANRTKRIAQAQLESQPDKARQLAPKLAAKRIAQDAKSTLEIGSTKNEKKYLNNLVNAIVSKAQEIYKDKAPPKPNVDDWLRIAIENLRNTDSLWKEAQREVEAKLDADTKLTELEKDQVKDFLDGYLESTVDILLTEPKKKEIVRQKLIEAGFFEEVTKDGVTRKVIDWSKIVGSEKTIAEAKEKIRSTIEGLGLEKEDTSSVVESLIHQFEQTVKDKRATEINRYLNKYNINKAKNVLGQGGRKRNVDKLIEYQDKGILTDERAREVLAKELGLTTITPEEFARVNELVELIKNTETPSQKKKFEEELEYIFATKSGNFEYELTKSRMLSNALGSIPNMIQNAVSGFGVTINQGVTAAIKTGDLIGALRIALKGLDKGWKDAKNIFLEGGVGRGTSFSDYTLVTEGAPRLRILEHKVGGKVFWIIPDIWLKAGKYKFNANQIVLNSLGKWTSRVLEATDALNSAPISELSQYVTLFNEIKRDNPTYSKAKARQATYDEMYKKTLPQARVEAINDLVNNAKIPNPTENQINRAAYELIETKRRQDVVGRGERDAARFTGRKSTYGITTVISAPLQWAQRGLSQLKTPKPGSSKYQRYAANAADFTANTAIPFANGIARWIELQMELVALYGLLKAGGYKVAAEVIKRTPSYQEKYNYKEIQSLANTYALRAAIGTAEMTAVGVILASLADDDEEWIKGIDLNDTPYGKKQVSNIVQPENTVNIKGHYIPLYLMGGLGLGLGVYASIRDARDAQQITPEQFRKADAALSFIALSQILSSIYGQRATNFGGMVTGWYKKDFDKDFGRFLGRNLRAHLPGAQLQYNIFQMLNPQAKEAENFAENLLLQTGVYGGWAGKDAFDYRGRPYDIGQASPMTPDGLVKMFEKNERADAVDKLLAKAGYNHTDVDQKNEKYWFLDEQGIYYPQDLDEDKRYDFRKRAAEIFNDKLTEYQDALQSAANLKDLEYFTPEEVVRRYAGILHSLSNDEAYKEVMPEAVLSQAELIIQQKFRDLESQLIGLQTGIAVPLQIENSLKDIGGVLGTINQQQQILQETQEP